MRRTYQNVVIDGKNNGTRPSRINSKFYNKGKWDTFIEPLIPDNCEDMTLTEFGCNAGLYLMLSRDKGFKKIVGIEMDKGNYEVAKEYLGDSYDLINVRVDRKFNINVLDNLPASDIILFANFHYHVHLPVMVNLVDRLRRKTRYVIVVTDPDVRTNFYRIKPTIKETRRLFKMYKEVKHIPVQDMDGDVSPRKMCSFLFKTEVERVPVDDVVKTMHHKMKKHYDMLMNDMIPAENKRYEFTVPLLLNEDGNLVDGIHRLATYVKDGYKDVLVERV